MDIAPGYMRLLIDLFFLFVLFVNKIGKQGKVVHTLRFCSKFPYGIFGKSACWGVSPIPIKHTINCVAAPPT